MKRRDFIQSLTGALVCTCAALSAGGFAFKNSKENNKKDDDKWVQHIEIPICYHCNLNCAYCDHFAPLAPKYEMPIEVFKKDIKQLAKITKGKVREIFLLGGEPLLHPNIEKLMEITSKYFPSSRKAIITNGLLLNNMPESFWRTSLFTNFQIIYTYYSKYEKYPDLYEAKIKSYKHYIMLTSYGKTEYFWHLALDSKGSYDKKTNYNRCKEKINCSLLDNGKLYACSSACATIKFFNSYFKEHQFKEYKEDYLDIHRITSIDEILNFYKKPKEFCRFCGYSDWKICEQNKKPWKLSNKDISEWLSS